ncbi:MAG TPA: agmatinase [Polyangiaceae bacterium]|jgi:agmatinase
MPQTNAFEYIRRGTTPFFRLPVADVTAAAPYTGADAVLLGVPFDLATTYQPGARFAPYAVRRVSALVQGFHPSHKVDVFRALHVLDGGNVAIPPFNAALARDTIENEVASVVAAGAVPFVLGGDHSVALPALRAVAKAHGPLAVVHVDAHLDTSGAEVWGDDHHHGTPLGHALREELIAPGGLHQVGIRATWGAPDDGELAASHGASLYGMDRISDDGIARVAEDIVRRVGSRPVYVTFDIDGVDPAFAPGTGTPVPGGLTSREAIRLLRGLAGVTLVGMDLVEVAPALDHADVTSHLAAQLLFEGLALVALSRGE